MGEQRTSIIAACGGTYILQVGTQCICLQEPSTPYQGYCRRGISPSVQVCNPATGTTLQRSFKAPWGCSGRVGRRRITEGCKEEYLGTIQNFLCIVYQKEPERGFPCVNIRRSKYQQLKSAPRSWGLSASGASSEHQQVPGQNSHQAGQTVWEPGNAGVCTR